MTDLVPRKARVVDGRAIRCVPDNAERAIHDTVRAVHPISLEDLVETADLQTRLDRKYFVPAARFRALMAELSTFTVLEIGGKRTFDYQSVYFDTPDVLTYRAHLQRRRRRFEARTRSYLDNRLCRFEVKTVPPRGATVKDRIVHQLERRASLTGDAHAFLAEILDRSSGHHIPPGMRAMLTSHYRRG